MARSADISKLKVRRMIFVVRELIFHSGLFDVPARIICVVAPINILLTYLLGKLVSICDAFVA